MQSAALPIRISASLIHRPTARANPRARANPSGKKILIGAAIGVAALYALSWAGYYFKTKPALEAPPDGSASLPGGEQADGTEDGWPWQIRYDRFNVATPYSWKVTSPDGVVTKSKSTSYANARAQVSWAIGLG